MGIIGHLVYPLTTYPRYRISDGYPLSFSRVPFTKSISALFFSQSCVIPDFYLPLTYCTVSYQVSIVMASNVEKLACESCIRGHRVAKCQHTGESM